MDGFISLVRDLHVHAGVPTDCISVDKRVELPGWFRAEKKWDLVIVRECELLAAIEFKSYRDRYAILIEKLLRDRVHDGACLLLSRADARNTGEFVEPNLELTFAKFVTPLIAHVSAACRMR